MRNQRWSVTFAFALGLLGMLVMNTGCSQLTKLFKGNKKAEATTFLKEIRASSCGQAVSVWEKVKKESRKASRSAKNSIYYTAGLKLAKCNKWDYVFVNLLHWSRKKGQTLLEKIKESGAPVESELMKWIKKQDNPFNFEHGSFAIRHTVAWLRKNDRKNHCSVFLNAAPKTSEKVRNGFIEYLYFAKCKGSLDIIAKQLQSNKGSLRRQACYILGRIGNMSHIKKMRILSYSDPAWRMQKRKYISYKVYYVRQACKAAVGKIRVRGN